MGRIKMGTVTQLALRQNLHCTATSPQPRETRIKQMYLHSLTLFGNTFGRYLKAQRAIIPCWQKVVFLAPTGAQGVRMSCVRSLHSSNNEF